MSKKQVTFADIAEYTNFSKTTISRYFNHPDSLTLENQEKISQALDILGYKKNKLAKVLANGKSEFIGIIVPNLYLHYYFFPATVIIIINFLFSPANMGRKKSNNTLKSFYLIRLRD